MHRFPTNYEFNLIQQLIDGMRLANLLSHDVGGECVDSLFGWMGPHRTAVVAGHAAARSVLSYLEGLHRVDRKGMAGLWP